MTERDAPLVPALLVLGCGFGLMAGTFVPDSGALVMALVFAVVGMLLLALWRRG